MPHNHLPAIPETVLKAHKVHQPGDTRFKAAARLLQALWRTEQGLPIGFLRTADGKAPQARQSPQCPVCAGWPQFP